ncbi:uncharacterized protein LOC114260111 [Camellia sinensis]|uniref:Uncharacterized protein n=1 Tax=Camellia sinensis var. sinensis TaxID=542762 RepID=A0A4S4EV78_CAMSN|nr:uncharacterized protein LOC114260111 [Camellia sinensis]THG20395.1 hypothetical protein TEA_013237 [Camellia sinensis var. sinensis]
MESFIAMASKLLIVVVFAFDVIAFALAIAAELRRTTATVKPNSDLNYEYCVYNSSISTWFGVSASLFLMASQVLVMVTTQCFCCGNAFKLEGSRASTLVLFITCWVFFIITEVCLLAGSVMNAHHTKYRAIFGENLPFCHTMRKGVFAAEETFVFLNCIVSEIYYICLSDSKESFDPYDEEASIALIISK